MMSRDDDAQQHYLLELTFKYIFSYDLKDGIRQVHSRKGSAFVALSVVCLQTHNAENAAR